MAEFEDELIGDLNYEYDDLDVDEEEEEALLAEEQEAEEEILQEDEEEEDLEEIIECHDKNDLNHQLRIIDNNPEIPAEMDGEEENVEEDDDEEEETDNRSRDRFRSERTKQSLTSERKSQRQIPDSLDQVSVQNVEKKGNFGRRGRNYMRRGFQHQGRGRFGGMQRPLLNQPLNRPPLMMQMGRPPWPQQMGRMQDLPGMQFRGPRPIMMQLQRLPMGHNFQRPLMHNYVVPLRTPWAHEGPQVLPDYEGSYLDFTSDDFSPQISLRKRPLQQAPPPPIPNKVQRVQQKHNVSQLNECAPPTTANKRGSIKSRLFRPKEDAPNPNLKTVPVVEILPATTQPLESNSEDSYVKKLEEQKRKREEFLKTKEKRRQATATATIAKVCKSPGDEAKAPNKGKTAKIVFSQDNKPQRAAARPRVELPPQANIKPRIISNNSRNLRMGTPNTQRAPNPQGALGMFNIRPQTRPQFQRNPPPMGPPNKFSEPPSMSRHPEQFGSRFPDHPPHRPFFPDQSSHSRPFPEPNAPGMGGPMHFFQEQNPPQTPLISQPPPMHFPNQPMGGPPPSMGGSSERFGPRPDLSLPPPGLPDTSVPPPPPPNYSSPYQQEPGYSEEYNEGPWEGQNQYGNQYYSEGQYDYNPPVEQTSEPDQYEASFQPPFEPEKETKSKSEPEGISLFLRSRLGKKSQPVHQIPVLASPSPSQPMLLVSPRKSQEIVKKTTRKKYKKVTNKKNGEVVMITLIPLDEHGNECGERIVEYKKEEEAPPPPPNVVSILRRRVGPSGRLPVKRRRDIGHNSKVKLQPQDYAPLSDPVGISRSKRRVINDSDDEQLNSQSQRLRIVKRPARKQVAIRTVISGSISSQCTVKLSGLPHGTTADDIWNASTDALVESPVNMELSSELGECHLKYRSINDARGLVNFIATNGINGVKVRAAIIK